MAVADSGSKTVVLASADAALRNRLRESLTGMRWNVREAAGGAEAMAQMEDARPEALVMDFWLPDLEAGEFADRVPLLYPGVDVLRVDGDPVAGSARSPRRHELLHALREAMDQVSAELPAARAPVNTDGPAWAAAPVAVPSGAARRAAPGVAGVAKPQGTWTAADRMRAAAAGSPPSWNTGAEEPGEDDGPTLEELEAAAAGSLLGASGAAVEQSIPVATGPDVGAPAAVRVDAAAPRAALPVLIPEMIGRSKPMLELARLIRLVAPRSATVLIEGETGTGKEVVAQALHRLSKRANKPFAVLNCAAIPEALLEAELFGHTRGAFTGAVTSRTGRIEAADGGTLFLDEIGEMPVALQAKMLRFLECGELQRVGDNEVVRVDVRVIAATHQHLERRAAEGTFRLDLYHRLAVFPVDVPPLRERVEDIAELSEFFLARLGSEAPRKRLSAAALARLEEHDWPGNVRELAHVLERATILAGDAPEITADEIRFRRATSRGSSR